MKTRTLLLFSVPAMTFMPASTANVMQAFPLLYSAPVIEAALTYTTAALINKTPAIQTSMPVAISSLPVPAQADATIAGTNYAIRAPVIEMAPTIAQPFISTLMLPDIAVTTVGISGLVPAIEINQVDPVFAVADSALPDFGSVAAGNNETMLAMAAVTNIDIVDAVLLSIPSADEQLLPISDAVPLEEFISEPAANQIDLNTISAASDPTTVSMDPAVAVAISAVAEPVQALAKVELPTAPEYISYADSVPANMVAATTSSAEYGMAGSAPAAAIQSSTAAAIGSTVSLDQAVAAALETNPEINQAIMNKEAIEFEREQAQGLYLPRVNLEASAGIRRLENRTRRAIGIDDDLLYPVEGSIVGEQTLVDFGRRGGELRRQAARTDGAALRIVERSQNIALLVSRQYLDILLQQRIVAAADDNVTFHRNLVGDLGQGVSQGSISIADQQQAQERLQAAIVRRTEAEEALVNAQISLQALTGLRVDGAMMPSSLRSAVAPTLGEAVGMARQNNPKVKEAMADVDAAHALAEKEKGDLFPTIGAEVRGRVGHDIDGFAGQTNDVQGRIVLRWNIFDGGINRAKYQEMVRRASEARFRLHEMTRYAEEDVQRAWNSMSTQGKISDELTVQSRVSDDLLLSYREQFNVGRRSLLDVLDAQNTRYNVQVRLETANFSKQFSEYQVLASTNNLLEAMGMNAPTAGTSDARSQYNYGPPAPAELQRRRYPR